MIPALRIQRFPGLCSNVWGVVPRFLLPFEMADGSIIQRDVGLAMLVINNSESSMRVIFGDDDAEPLIGANALQEFLLMVDPVEERLVPRTGRMKPLGRGKQNGMFYCSIEVGDLNGDNFETVGGTGKQQARILASPADASLPAWYFTHKNVEIQESRREQRRTGSRGRPGAA